jgi:hypothetical protein
MAVFREQETSLRAEGEAIQFAEVFWIASSRRALRAQHDAPRNDEPNAFAGIDLASASWFRS